MPSIKKLDDYCHENDLVAFAASIDPKGRLYPWQEEMIRLLGTQGRSRLLLYKWKRDVGKSKIEAALKEMYRSKIQDKEAHTIIIDDPIKDVTVDE